METQAVRNAVFSSAPFFGPSRIRTKFREKDAKKFTGKKEDFRRLRRIFIE
jgi:hypothetical protein